MKKMQTGQGALEYLLLLAGVVLIAAVLIALIFGLGGLGSTQTHEGAENVTDIFNQTKHDLFPGGGGTPITCPDGDIDAGETCDGLLFGVETCLTQGFESGSLSCDSSCQIDTSTCTDLITCGDNEIDAGETCDGTYVGEESCSSQGFFAGTLQCNAACTGFDTSLCTNCGNGTIDAGEQCEAGNLNGQTCQSLGYAGGGALACGSTCGFDSSQCVPGALTNFRANVFFPNLDDVQLGWSPYTGNGTTIKIIRNTTTYPVTPSDGAEACNVAISETICIDSNLPDRTYYYSAFAMNGATYSNRVIDAVTVDTTSGGNFPPLTPMLFALEGLSFEPTTSSLGSGTMQFTWSGECFEDDPATNYNNCPTNDIDYYKIYYKTGSQANNLAEYTNVIDTRNNSPPNAPNHTQPGFTQGTTYHYYIMAIDSIGQEGTTFTPGSQKSFTPN